MKITKFKIQNYKGIKETEIVLNGNPGSIYTLVGINESGKTTILEALNRLRSDKKGVHVMAQESVSAEPIETESPESLIPKKERKNFSGKISISATVQMTEEDVSMLASKCQKELGIQIDTENFPFEFTISRVYKFEHSKYIKTKNTWNFNPLISIKRKKSKKFIKINKFSSEWLPVVRMISNSFPRIIYFPTFLFKFPEKIKISDEPQNTSGITTQEGKEEEEKNEYFKSMINDALFSLDNSLRLDVNIIDKVNENPEKPFGEWLESWNESEAKESVEALLGDLSKKITEEVFGRWAEVLGADIGSKEVEIVPIINKGKQEERIVYLSFKVKDGKSSFKISERSLGFRWFFCFLMFTRFFRGNNKGESIFLFDEPASNLHSIAQTKLLESLKVIARDKNDIIYSTHSHHLINPLWLEKTYVISNGEPTEDDSTSGKNFNEVDSDIKAVKYSVFARKNPGKGHYFQPILDKLQVVPSKLEATRKGVLTEGKSDFYILSWYKKHCDDSIDLDFIPLSGAATGSGVISIYLGMCINFVFLLDGDKGGEESKKKYLKDFEILADKFCLISDVFGSDKTDIESLISENMKKMLIEDYENKSAKEIKRDILLAFSEALSGGTTLEPDKETLDNLAKLCKELKTRLDNLQ